MATKKAKPAVEAAAEGALRKAAGRANLPFKNLQLHPQRLWTIKSAKRQANDEQLVYSSAQMIATGTKEPRTSFTVPAAVQDRFRNAIVGPWTSTMVILADWALDQLKAKNQKLVISTNRLDAAERNRRNFAHAAGMQRARDAKLAAAAKKKRLKTVKAV